MRKESHPRFSLDFYPLFGDYAYIEYKRGYVRLFHVIFGTTNKRRVRLDSDSIPQTAFTVSWLNTFLPMLHRTFPFSRYYYLNHLSVIGRLREETERRCHPATIPLWFRTTENRNISTTCLFTHSRADGKVND